MTVLGEAFIAVHADMSPFHREIKENSKKDVDILEEAYGKQLGKIVADAISDGAEEGGRSGGKKAAKGLKDGIGKDLGSKDTSLWVSVTGALAGALDDGISALPAEIKAAIIVALLAAAPLVMAGIAGAIGAGVAGGFVGLGVALATQFEAVQTRWASFQSTTRNSLVNSAKAFQLPLLETLDIVEQRVLAWEDLFAEIFGSLAKFLDPIVNALLDTIEYILDVVKANLGNIDIYADALVEAIYILGEGLAEVLDIILSMGDDGRKAFLDLVFILTSMIVATIQLVAWLGKAYNFLRDAVGLIPDLLLLAGPLGPLALLFKGVTAEVDAGAQATRDYAYTNVAYVEGIGTVVALTKDEEKALQELKKSIDAANEAAWNAIDANINFEESLDNIEEAIKRNGKTLDITTKEGRNNLREIGDALKIAQEKAKERAESGAYNQQQLTALYDAEIERVYKAAEAQGISRDRLREVYGVLIDMLKLPPPDTQWARDLAMYAAGAANALERANRAAWNLPNRIGGNQAFAEGGIVRGPTQALIGEAGTEVVIPMTRPGRAAELMRQSGLDRMLGGGGNVSVQVFLGNQAFDQHVQKIVVQDNRANARQLGFGVR